MINLENINLNYKDTKALKDITIEFPEHGICGLLGRNGAGKTSLLSLISGYRQATSGRPQPHLATKRKLYLIAKLYFT